MAFNLAIDIGNSKTKFGLFQAKKLLQFKVLDNQALAESNQLFIDFEPQWTILSSVNQKAEQQLHLEEGNSKVIRLSHDTNLPFDLHYQTPETLGKDRIAAIAAAQAAYPNENVLSIDAGTCVTYDFLDAAGHYYGGAISPGIQMRLKAMHHFTAQLPLLSWNGESAELTGKSSISSMLSGAVNGLRLEVDGFIDSYMQKYEHLNVLVTGGDAPLFEKDLKNGIFADPNLVLKGLNEILLYNCD